MPSKLANMDAQGLPGFWRAIFLGAAHLQR
jgi:hypothetical protein